MENTTKKTDRIITLIKEVTVTEEDINNIFYAATYGGSWYWCPEIALEDNKSTEINYGKHLNEGGVVQVWEDDEESDDPNDWALHKIKLNDVLKGIDLYMHGDYAYSLDIIQNRHGKCVLDCTVIDSTVADCILQLSVFGEVIYG